MKTSIYIPDDLYASLKLHRAPIPTIVTEALEAWQTEQGVLPDANAALRMIERGTRILRSIHGRTT